MLARANPLLSPGQLEAVVIRGVATGVSMPPVQNFAQLDQDVRAARNARLREHAGIFRALFAGKTVPHRGMLR